MYTVCLVGYGPWGKKIFFTLKKSKFIKKIFLVKNIKQEKIFNKKNIDWFIVATNIENHYKLVKKFILLKKNVFCEKPLTEDLNKNRFLYNLAKKKQVKLYVSDIENYKNKKLNLLNINTIKRYKFSKNKKNIIFRLAYHDFTYIYKYLKFKKISKIKIIKKGEGFLEFEIFLGQIKFIMKYNLNFVKKIHFFNETNLSVKSNVLKKMIKQVFNNKVNFKLNKKISIFSSKICYKLNKKISKKINS